MVISLNERGARRNSRKYVGGLRGNMIIEHYKGDAKGSQQS